VADPDRLVELAERILDRADSVELRLGPRPATMLVELTETVRAQPFHLGEVVVTEASVVLNGCRGDGIVLGLSTERALAAALCDAAAQARLFALDVDRLVEETERTRAAQRGREAAAVADTRISVEVLP